MQQKIIILPCGGLSAAGQITRIASQELVLEGKAEWYRPASQPNEPSIAHSIDTENLIILDGCDRQCIFTAFLKKGITAEQQLTLTDVGIDTINMEDITRNDIELAKDAVIAECTSVDTMRRPLFSGCCCK